MKKRNHLFKIALLSSVIAMTSVQMCAAAEVTTQDTASTAETAPASISTNEIPGWPAGPEITSETGVLIDADSGTVLYSKGGDDIRYPASITKIMTLLLAVENCSLKEDVVFTETGTRDISWDSGNIGMQVGEVMSMRACLYALIIQSANEVAAQIAEHVGGTEQNFIDMMNQRAAEIGCTNTHFANASGLPDPNHYSTAHDMALIMREGLKNKKFRRIIGTTDYTIKPTNMNSEARVLHTHHPMFAPESGYYYNGCIGGKTGYTSEAGNTLVTAVEQNGTTYITVTMKAADLAVASTDSTALFNYGFQNFTKLQVNGGEILAPNGVTVDNLTVQESQENGETVDSYYYNDYLLGSVTVPEATPTPEPAADTASENGGGADTSDGSETVQSDSTQTSDQTKTTAEDSQTSAGRLQLRKILLGIGATMVLLIIILCIALARKERRYSE